MHCLRYGGRKKDDFCYDVQQYLHNRSMIGTKIAMEFSGKLAADCYENDAHWVEILSANNDLNGTNCCAQCGALHFGICDIHNNYLISSWRNRSTYCISSSSTINNECHN